MRLLSQTILNYLFKFNIQTLFTNPKFKPLVSLIHFATYFQG